jgi:MFS family permease
MGLLAIGLSMNFGLANTIVQERAPSPLRGRVSAVFAMSFFGIMPIAGLGIPGLADLIGMRTTLGLSAVIFGIGSFLVLNAAGRKVCESPATPVPEPEAAVLP